MRNAVRVLPLLFVLAATLAAAPMTRIKVVVTTQSGKPVDRASVIVKFLESPNVMKLGKRTTTRWELRTNQEGEVKIPELPQGKIQFQVIAKGYQTFGQVFTIADEEKTVEIKLNPPQQQYSAHQ
jgi:uncharacterized GH25 family protein